MRQEELSYKEKRRAAKATAKLEKAAAKKALIADTRARKSAMEKAALKAEEGKLSHKRAMEIELLKSKKGTTTSANRLRFDQARLRFDQAGAKNETDWKQIEFMDKQNIAMATNIDEFGNSVLDQAKYQALSEPMMKLISRAGRNTGSNNAGGDILSSLNSLPINMQNSIRDGFSKNLASKTNKFGDDLTENAPVSNTSFKDGKRTWEYPGVKNQKTGGVQNYLSVTSPYGSEQEYQDRPGVVGQNPDGSWIYDENAKGQGGGFFQRGGLSDLGSALAGDPQRKVPNTRQSKQMGTGQIVNKRTAPVQELNTNQSPDNPAPEKKPKSFFSSFSGNAQVSIPVGPLFKSGMNKVKNFGKSVLERAGSNTPIPFGNQSNVPAYNGDISKTAGFQEGIRNITDRYQTPARNPEKKDWSSIFRNMQKKHDEKYSNDEFSMDLRLDRWKKNGIYAR